MAKMLVSLKHKRKTLLTVEVANLDTDPFDPLFKEMASRINRTLSGNTTKTLVDALTAHAEERKNTESSSRRAWGYRSYQDDTGWVKSEINVGRYRQNFRMESKEFQWMDGNVLASKEVSKRRDKDGEDSSFDRWVVMAGLPEEQGRTKVGGVFSLTRKDKTRGKDRMVEFTIKEYCVCASLEMDRWGRSFILDGKKSPPQHIPIRIVIGERGDDQPLKFEWDLAVDAEEARHGTIFELFDTAMLLSRRMRQIIYASYSVGRTCKMALQPVNSRPIRVKV